uniref:Uncharacterized protein n=1 Tax=Kalanchoe fedtschenkoi TaxID=63787 RepID=A0A7N0T482_KALFE
MDILMDAPFFITFITTSIPSTTCPNTTCLPSSHSAVSVVMKKRNPSDKLKSLLYWYMESIPGPMCFFVSRVCPSLRCTAP